MKDHNITIANRLLKISNYSEGLTSLLAGTYVLSLAVANKNLALRVALGVAGGYLILRSGSKLHSGSMNEEII